MRLRLSILLLAWSVAPLAAQEVGGGYVRLAIGSNWLQPPGPDVFEIDPALQPSVALGFTVKERHSFEMSWARVETESLDERTIDGFPHREEVGVTATSLGVGYRYGIRSPYEWFRPSAHLRLTRWSVENMVDSDTQPQFYGSTIYGIGPGVGLALHLFGDAWAVARGEYRWSTDTEAPRSRIGLSGPQVEVGLELGF